MKTATIVSLLSVLSLFAIQCSGAGVQNKPVSAEPNPQATADTHTTEPAAEPQPEARLETEAQEIVIAQTDAVAAEETATETEGVPTEETEAVPQEPTVAHSCVVQWFNGGDFQAAPNSDILTVEFPGNYSQSGKLHRILQDGQIQLDINTNLPLGASKIVRSTNGHYYIGGGDWQRTQVIKINPENGASLQTVLEGVPAVYATLLAVDSQQSIYLLSDRQLYRVKGQLVEPFAADMAYVPQMIVETNEVGKFFVADASHLGSYKENGGHHPIDIITNALVQEISTDGQGNLYALLLVGERPGNCLFGFGTCESRTVLYRNGQAPAIPVFSSSSTILGVAFDFGRNELAIVSQTRPEQGDNRCGRDFNFVITRVGNLENLSGAAVVAESEQQPAEQNGQEETSQNQCPVCGSGTQLQNNVCIPVPTHRFQCGTGTVAVGDRCVPQYIADCNAMFEYCMNACDVIEVPRLGWGPCTRACYASEDYCEDHFRAPAR